MKEIPIFQTLSDHFPEKVKRKRVPSSLRKSINRYRWLYLMMIPPLVYFIIFQYLPLWNAQIAFKDFKPLLGVWKSPFTGFDHFITFFKSFYLINSSATP